MGIKFPENVWLSVFDFGKKTILKFLNWKKSRAERNDFVRWINVRHPFSRLLSAWRQKFDKNYSGVDQYMKYVEKIQLFKGSEPDDDHVASFDGFLSYTANVANDEFYNEHWKS